MVKVKVLEYDYNPRLMLPSSKLIYETEECEKCYCLDAVEKALNKKIVDYEILNTNEYLEMYEVVLKVIFEDGEVDYITYEQYFDDDEVLIFI